MSKAMHPTVVIHQPDFLPYIGFFERLLHASVFIVLDHVQFSPGGWHHRDRIKTANGTQWLSLPVLRANKHLTPICDVMLSPDGRWRTKHLRSIEQAYRRCRHFDEVFEIVRSLYSREIGRLTEFNLAGIEAFLDYFGIGVDVLRSSAMNPCGASNEMLIDLARKSAAPVYLSGDGAREYMDEAMWAEAGIEVRWQSFVHPTYPQPHGAFVANLSCIDVAMNVGRDLSGLLSSRDNG